MKPIPVFVSVIDTDRSDIYDGSRITVCLTREEAEEDARDWIEGYAIGDHAFDGHLATFDAASRKYLDYTGRQCKVEETILPSPELLVAFQAAVKRMEAVATGILVEKRHKGVSQRTHVAHMASHLAQHAKIARAAIAKATGEAVTP